MSAFISRHAGLVQLVFVVGVVGFAVTLSSISKPASSSVPETTPALRTPVSVVAPIDVTFRPYVQLNGVVEARTVTELTPQVAGRVIRVSDAFRTGGKVARGETLFVIDPSDYELAVERTLAEIEAARSELALLEAEASAERQVWATQFPDRDIPDLRARVPQIAAAKARVRSAEAARRSAELSLERTVVRAPFDARVLDTRLDVGQVVSTNASVGSMFALDSLEVAVPVSADELRRIGDVDGRETIISRETGGRLLQGQIVRMGASVDERTRLATLFVASKQASELTVGEFVTVSIEGTETPRALRIPNESMTARDRLWVVDGGRLEARTVDVLGGDSDSTIVAHFDTADGVVAVPPPSGHSGMPVTTPNETSLASPAVNSARSK